MLILRIYFAVDGMPIEMYGESWIVTSPLRLCLQPCLLPLLAVTSLHQLSLIRSQFRSSLLLKLLVLIHIVKSVISPISTVFVSFLSKKFGSQNRAFNSKWFDNEKWSQWLHWDNHTHKSFCYICRCVFSINHLTMYKNMKDAYICSGFDNWKRATSTFEQHRRRKCHQESVFKCNQHIKGISIKIKLDKQVNLE